MSRLWVTEYTGRISGPPVEPSERVQVLELSAFVAKFEPFGKITTMVRLHSDDFCHFKFHTQGSDDEPATERDSRLGANSSELFAVRPGAYVTAVIGN